MASGSQAAPISIPFIAVTNSDGIPSGSPARRRRLRQLRRAHLQPTKVQEPPPPAISELVSESTQLVLDPPTPFPTPWDPSRLSPKPPTRTGWFSKSGALSSGPIHRPLPDQLIPPSPAPSLHVVEAPSTSSFAGRGPGTSTAYNRGYIPSIPLLGRSNVKAQVVIDEELGMSLCSPFIQSANIKLKH